MKKEIIERIIARLEDYEGANIYGADLAYTLFEGENVDGSFTYNSYEAKEWIKKYYDDIAEVYDELKFSFGEEYIAKLNMFENPEAFMVIIILESANYILGRCKFVEDNWNEKIELTKKNIKKIQNELLLQDDGGSIYEI